MKRKMCLFLLLLPLTVAGAAGPPDIMNYQGVLRDAADNPLDGAYDMVFRFWSTDIGGDEILIDRHLAIDSNEVVVTGGLFDVLLGTGDVVDGGSVGTYTALGDVFLAHEEVWLEIQIGPEVLSPRVRVAAAAYAHNAASLGGMSAGSFLDASGSSQSKTGSLDLGALSVSGDVSIRGNAAHLNHGGPDGSAFLYFHNDGNDQGEWLAWNDNDARFEMSDTLYARRLLSSSNIFINFDGPDQGSALYFYNNGISTGESLSWDDTLERFSFSDDLSLFGTLEARVVQVNDGRIAFNPNGPDQTQVIEFFEDGVANGERLQWDDGDDRFEVSDDLHAFGTISAAAGFGLFGVEATGQYQAFRVGGGGRFEDTAYTGVAYVGHGNEGIYAEGSFLGGEFKDTDSGNFGRVGYSSYKVYGNGTVSFVQNHPEDAGKVIVYHAPESSEVAVYTRGSARLEDGVARVALDETFRWTANPDLGLTVHLTPREHVTVPLVADSISTTELIVRGPDGSDAAFDFLVYGLRIGFEESSVVQPKEREAYLPAMDDHVGHFQIDPALRDFTARARFERIETGVHGRSLDGPARAADLAARIGRFDPAIHADDHSSRNVTAAANHVAGVADTQDARPGIAATASAEAALAGVEPVPGNGLAILEVSGGFEVGDVLALDTERPGFLRRADEMAAPTLFGVAVDLQSDGRAAVAMSDLVEVRADAAYGAIRPGDLLVSSPTPGHAMRAHEWQPGTVLGKALDGLETGTGTIRVLITLR